MQVRHAVHQLLQILVIDAMPGVHLDAQGMRQFRGAFQTGQFRGALFSVVVGKTPGVQLNHGRAEARGGFHLGQVRINEQAHLNVVVRHSGQGRRKLLFMEYGVQAAFRRDFLPLFRNHANIVRFQLEGKIHHFRGVPHLQIQGKGHALPHPQGV